MEYYKVYVSFADDTQSVPVGRVTGFVVDRDTDILTFYRESTVIAVFRDWSYFVRSVQEVDIQEAAYFGHKDVIK